MCGSTLAHMSKFKAAGRRALAWLGFATPAATPATFSWGPIDALIRGIWGPDGSSGPASRDEAMSLASFERGCSELCSIGTLPLINYRGTEIVPNAFLDQPDPDVPRVVMFAQTIEDLVCDGVSWWLKTAVDYRGFPVAARRVVNVTLQPPNGQAARTPAPLPSGQDPRGASVWVDGVETPASNVIRFDSPVRPVLASAARTIRRGLLLDALAAMYAENPRPLEAFTDTDDQTVVPYTDDEIVAFLATYRAGRKSGRPAWIPREAQPVDMKTPSAADLQLVQLQQQVSLELALFLGLDPEDVGVNTTSRTYFNGTDRDRNKINRTFAPYMSAITDRLSMRDVTPHGQRVRWDLADYLKPDATTQATYWKSLKELGVVDETWIGEQAGVPAGITRRAKSATSRAAAAAPPPPANPGAENSLRWLPAQLGPALTAARLTYSAEASMRVFSTADFGVSVPAAKADIEKRTITGLAVPYGAIARKYGVGFRFRPGSLEYDAGNLARLRVKDDHTTHVGVHSAVQDTKQGPVVSLKILDGPEGSPTKMHRDQLLMDAAAGLADGLSVGVDFSLDPEVGDVIWSEQEQVFDVLRATWNETSVTPNPAFTGARVTRVAASRSGGSMDCQHCGRPHPSGMACAVAAQLYPAPVQQAQFAHPYPYALPYPQQPVQPHVQPYPQQQHVQPLANAAVLPTGPTSTAELSAALQNAVEAMVANGQVAATPPAAQPGQDLGQFAQPVHPGALPIPGQGQPTAAGVATVREPEPYTIGFRADEKGVQAFLGRGSHDFSTDVILALRDRDAAAHQRAMAFVAKHMVGMFNVATTDVNEANPTKQRPDMYVDQRSYRYPLWSAINKGTLTDITPFTFPKFSSAGSLVAAHTEGSEPSTGTFVTTGQTITPTAYSGKARINREVWDQGGNPQISTLIWNQMQKGVFEALEAAAVTELNAGSFTALATLTAGNADTGQTLGAEIEGGLASLQFVRGGYAFTDAFAQADLYKALAAAKDADKRPLYPMLGPANANGQTSSRFGSIDVAGQLFHPEWALAAAGQTAATKSYLLDRQSVHGWASAPQRLVLDEIAVAYVDLGVWGYQATAVSDTTGVRTITWDPVA